MFANVSNCDKGFSLLGVLTGIAAGSILIMAALQTQFHYILQKKEATKRQIGNSVLQHELDVTFSHVEICAGRVQFRGDNQFIISNMQPGQHFLGGGNHRIDIDAMTVSNIQDLGDGWRRATFNVDTRSGERRLKRNSIQIEYQEQNGVMTACRRVISPEEACVTIGARWNGANRCEICERIGGTWSDNACVISSQGRI